jgi:hypothetical protein
VKLSWTQPVCDDDWAERNPDRPNPVRMNPEFTEQEQCCYCGKPTKSGIYVRVDPATVPFPASEEE